MDLYELTALLLTVAAFFSYANHRWLKLPTTIGLMVIALIASSVIIILGNFYPAVEHLGRAIIERVNFDDTLMNGMLGLLLFAGALHINVNDLAQNKWIIALLASVGVILSTLIVGLVAWLLLGALGIPNSFIYCLLFGALISPTDPIAVLGILKYAGAPKSLETKITGESLFNDGIAVVVFLGLLQIATGEHGFDIGHLATLFVEEAIGGAIFGLVIGFLAYQMLKSVDNYQVEVLISIAVAAGGYALANHFHLSGPIAMVVAGLLIGNHGRSLAMSPKTVEHLDMFWELMDEILNAVLFVLIGLELLVLPLSRVLIIAGVCLFPLIVLARLISVGLPVRLLRSRRTFTVHVVKVLTWGGLRGGISVALALSIPSNLDGIPVQERDPIVVITYAIVVLSIIGQGLTIGPLIRRLFANTKVHDEAASSIST